MPGAQRWRVMFLQEHSRSVTRDVSLADPELLDEKALPVRPLLMPNMFRPPFLSRSLGKLSEIDWPGASTQSRPLEAWRSSWP